MSKSIKITDVKKLTDFKWLNLFETHYVDKNGKEGTWQYASRKKSVGNAKPLPNSEVAGEQEILDRLAETRENQNNLIADAVIVIPIFKEKKKRRLVVLKEFRIPLQAYEYSFPAGLYDPNESAIDVAKRELKEETGLDLTKVLYIGPACVSSAGLSDESVVYVVCECEGVPSTLGNEGTEDIQINFLSAKKLDILARSNVNLSAKCLPFFLLFTALKKIKWPKRLRN